MTTPVITYDPTTSIVGNGIAGQVNVVLLNDYSWRILSQGLPGLVTTGTFPNPENTSSIQRTNLSVTWPYRGGYNLRASVPPRRPSQTPVALSVVGLPIYSPNNPIKVAGRRGSVWTLDTVTADINGNDDFSGFPDSNGVYRYFSAAFVSNNAWQNIPGFLGDYRHPDGHSKIIAWAADGYPIYGPYGYVNPNSAISQPRLMISGYEPIIRADRPADPIIETKGSITRSDTLRVKNPQVAAPGLRLSGSSLPGEVKVLQVIGDSLILDTAVTIGNNARLQGTWPLGIFVEDWEYTGNGNLDRSNGRFCVTPEFPTGTYAYFATVDDVMQPRFPYFVGPSMYGSLEITPPPPPPPLTWVTPGGSFGTLSQNVFFQIQLEAVSAGRQVFYEVIAGSLPSGVQVVNSGLVSGVPTIPSTQPFGNDITSTFVIRAFTRDLTGTIDQLQDQTFSITIAGASIPDFATPAGLLGTYYDGSPIDPIQLEFTEPLRTATCRVVGGSLPQGLELSPTGEIFGFIGLQPLVDQPAGYSLTEYSEYGYDFLVRSSSYNYQFTVEISDGRQTNLRTFEIFVTSRNDLTADNTTITGDTTIITADQSNDRIPFVLNPQGSIGTVIDDNYFAYKFDAVDLDGQAVRYDLIIDSGPGYNWSIPPGLTLDPETGWLYGYIPSQGISLQTFTIAIRVGNISNPGVLSEIFFYTLTVISGIDTRLEWITASELGTIINGGTSLFAVEARALAGVDLQYKLKTGSNSRLPQGLRLLPSGRIAGNVSFNTFAFDGGSTTFDRDTTTFDLTYRFTVTAFAPAAQQLIFRVTSITVVQPGTGFTTTPVVTIAPPDAAGEPATVLSVQMVSQGPGQGLGIESVSLASNGIGYRTAPVITVTGDGSGAQLIANMQVVSTSPLITGDRTFSIRIDRRFNAPLDTLFIRALAPESSRSIIDSITQDTTILPEERIFRPDDFNFGISKRVYFAEAFGLPADTADEYQRSLELNHYWKNLTLSPVKTAQALDASGSVIYEVIYSEVIDNLVNNEGESVGKEVNLEIPVVYHDDSTEITTVYPNSLDNMRTQVINSVGEVSPALPLWMTSLQSNGQQLGYTPAWVIAYVKPGASRQIAFEMNAKYGNQFNLIDWEVDRYELGRSQSYNWDPIYDSTGGSWVPEPSSTTFDLDNHYWPATSDGSTEIFFGGVGYSVGTQIRVLGSALNGTNGFNDLNIFVTSVDAATGAIKNFYVTGISYVANPVGTVFSALSGVNVKGTGTGANFDIQVQGTSQATIFDGGSMQFTVPIDVYNPGDDFNKYLVFPKRNILE